MLTLGYIISDTKYSDLEEGVITVVNKEEDCYPGFPKLIVGLSKAKEYALKHGFSFDILNNTFPNKDMWTFKKTEKRDYYERDIEQFKKVVKEAICDKIKYYYINIYALKYSKAKQLYRMLFNNLLNRRINYVLVDRKMIYFPLDNDKVIGISFNHLQYIGIDKDKVIDKLKKEKSNRIYYTTSKKMWKICDYFKGNNYVIPVLMQNTEK